MDNTTNLDAKNHMLASATTQAGYGQQPPSDGGDLSPPEGGIENRDKLVQMPGQSILSQGVIGDPTQIS